MDKLGRSLKEYARHVNRSLSRQELQTKHTFTVSQPWFDLIKSGDKTVEGRLGKGKFEEIKVGDAVIWIHNELTCKTMITYIHRYKTFEEYLSTEGIVNALPVNYVTTVQEGIQVYRKYYSEEKELLNGVLAIGLVRI